MIIKILSVEAATGHIHCAAQTPAECATGPAVQTATGDVHTAGQPTAAKSATGPGVQPGTGHAPATYHGRHLH